MSWWSTLFGRRAPRPVVRPPLPAAGVGVGLAGRATYAGLAPDMLIAPDVTLELLQQFRRRVPVIKRTTEILSGFAGIPEFECESEADEEYLNQWAATVPYGDGVGFGIAPWLDDLIDQGLTYGFTVGEGEIGARRDGIARLWTYLSPSVRFRTSQTGAVTPVQAGLWGVERRLERDTVVRFTHDPRGCNPYGESLLLALPAVCEALVQIHHSNTQTWRRSGIPVYHIHTELPSDLADPDGSISAQVVAATEAAWNEGMRSQVVDGVAKDFFTASAGVTSVKAIGADSPILDFEISNKVLMEQIISATGIPPFLFGLSWSTTERMSQQQLETLLATVACVRREAEAPLRQLVDLHLRLTGRKIAYKIEWPDLMLQDLLQTAQAANTEAQADLARLKYALECWRVGFWDQYQAAEHATGDAEVALEMDEPPGAMPEQPAAEQPGTGANAFKAYADTLAGKARAEAHGEYPALLRCNGKH